MMFLIIFSFSLATINAYHVVDQQKTWQDAESYCFSNFGTHLATFENEAQITQLLNERDASLVATNVWIGLNDIGTDGQWEFSNGYNCGSNCNGLNEWWDGEPSNMVDEDCAEISAGTSTNDLGNLLNDSLCSSLASFICDTQEIWSAISTPIFPYEFSRVPVGYSSSNNKVWILATGTRLVSYSLIDNSVTDHPGIVPDGTIGGRSQYWVQIGSVLYSGLAPNIHSFDLDTNIFTPNFQTSPNSAYSDHTCLATVHDANIDYLVFLLGGGSIQILNINTNTWLTAQELPPYSVGFGEQGCLTVNTLYHRLWIFGGWPGDGTQNKKVSYLDVSDFVNIAGRQWQSSDDMAQGRTYAYGVQHGNDIWVMSSWYNDVQIINTVTGATANGSTLAVESRAGAFIKVEDRIYNFGGLLGFRGLQYVGAAITDSPTHNPSIPPTKSPTKSPTHNPSIPPTKSPTKLPTRNPSISPTKKK
eukprot:459863_1